MKNTFTILALAATAAATGFRDAPAFSCPGNTNNQCTEKQSSGFDFGDLGFGSFSSYNNFGFKGWTCGSDSSKRFAPRTGGKKISGVCGHTKDNSPSFGCAKGDKFSLGGVHVKPEFDCDLEFHYEMPDGSSCKHRSRCSKSGTDVKNDQCGGATSVTVVYPPQPTHTKTTCSIDIHSMTFDCSSSSTKPPKTTTTKPSSTKPTSGVVSTTTSPTKGVDSTTSSTKGVDSTTSSTKAIETSSSTAAVETSPPAVTSPPVTTSAPFGNGTTSESIKQTTSESIKETTSQVISQTTSETTSTYVTSFLSTSTIFTTSTSTITSCAPTVTNCPAGGVKTTVVTVAVSTTICPVTETRTTVQSNTKPTEESTKILSTVQPVSSAPGTTSDVAFTTSTTSVKPVETLPCPNVVPQCLNTFLFSVACSDNSDSACYCPDEIFVKNIFNCIYAHGESAQVVSEAVIFFQGICAPYVPTNPAIATGATVTSYVTASATAAVTTSLAPAYTTVTVVATTVVPCTDSAGSTISSSSSTVIVSTAITVPNVVFTTGTGSASSVGLVPVTATATTAAAVTGGSKPTTTLGQTLITAPAGTGGVTARPSSTGIVTVSSSHRISAGFGLALAVMALVAAL